MSEEEKMSDEEFISEIRATGLYDSAEEELRKRLSKNNKTINFYSTQEIEYIKNNEVLKFKKRLWKEIENNNCIMGKKMIYDLINNIGKEQIK